jgi:LAO/AO transport system kinase
VSTRSAASHEFEDLNGNADRLIDRVRQGNRRDLARALSYVEYGGAMAQAIGRAAWANASGAHLVGITGAPGAGKSTLTSALIKEERLAGDVVTVLAIDPSSPFSGGAILGDRIRMMDHALDDGVFIRSMAARGHLGGLSLAAPQALRVMDASSPSRIILETVGVGQTEIEIAGAADTVVVVVNPGWGDDVQANKAGLLEIADIFVINKADREGVSRCKRDLEQMLDLNAELLDGWRPPIICTVAVNGEGVSELDAVIRRHEDHLRDSGRLVKRRSARVKSELEKIIALTLTQRALLFAGGRDFQLALDRVLAHEIDLYSAAELLVSQATPD